MSKVVVIHRERARMPQVCVVCMKPAAREYPIRKMQHYGYKRVTVTLKVPMCEEHYTLATEQNSTEYAISIAGMVLGFLLGAATAIGILLMKASAHNSDLAGNIFVAAFMGVIVIFLVWAIVRGGIAPLFADSEAKKARSSAQIDSFSLTKNTVKLDLENEKVADLIVQANMGV